MADYSNNTFATAKAAFIANCDWFAEGSTTKASAFVSAATALLILLPNSSLKGSNSIGFTKSEIQDQLQAAKKFVQANRSRGGIVRADLRNFRQ